VTAPRYPLEGVASWNMNTTCNYRCSYCTQRFVDDRGRWARDLPRFIAAFAALPGDWEIKLSGGEPFRHPDFLPTVRALVAARRRVSVVTNLASPLSELLAYALATAARPGVFSASLHLEYADPDQFLEKARAVQAQHAGSFVVTCVATRTNLPRLSALRDHYERAGVAFRVQPEKQDRDVIDYDDRERTQLVQLGGHNGTGDVAPSFAGRSCWAGARYFIVDHEGEAFRCYPARRQRRERLGNLLDGSFRLRLEPEPCRYTYCNCTVPQQRGMVETGRS
jgi:MoaA/NifB/PqqE/SkfB family radical SAM enzyme